MKNPLQILTRMALSFCCVALMLIISCGDAGIGFNVSKEFPVEVPVEIAFPTLPDEISELLDSNNPNFNPPAEEFVYDLGEVGAFDDALDGLTASENIVINSLSYEILGVDANEEAPLDQLAVNLNTSAGEIPLILETEAIRNRSKTEIPLTNDQRNSIINELFNNEQVDANIVFDLSAVPELSNIGFQFVIHFDITLRARDL